MHMFHPEMFTTLPIQDRNEKGKLASGFIYPQVEEKRAGEQRQVSDQVLLYSIAGGRRS